MKRMVQVCAFLLSSCAALAQGTLQVVLPAGYANVEGNSASGDLFRTTGSIFQQVYAASSFGFLGGATGRIDGIAFRFDGGANQSFIGIWPALSVSMSTTPREPDSLSPTYSDNVGSDVTTVYGGSLAIIAPAEAGLRTFQVYVPFSTPFFYDPTRGNLLMTIGCAAGPTNLILDAQFASGDSVSSVFGGVTIDGIPDTVGLISRFTITPIPEPSSAAIALSTCVCWLLVCWRRRSVHKTDRE